MEAVKSLGRATAKNPPAYGAWNAGTVGHGTGEALPGLWVDARCEPARLGLASQEGVGAGHSTAQGTGQHNPSRGKAPQSGEAVKGGPSGECPRG